MADVIGHKGVRTLREFSIFLEEPTLLREQLVLDVQLPLNSSVKTLSLASDSLCIPLLHSVGT